jgi:hypothetical protein
MKHPSLQYVDKARDALLHLHKVTGKWGLNAINPMTEKRWSEKCWECYHTLSAVNHLICEGTDYDEALEEIVKSATFSSIWKDVTHQHLTTGKYKSSVVEKYSVLGAEDAHDPH